MSKIREFLNSIDNDVKTAIAIVLAFILLFGTGNFIGGIVSGNREFELEASGDGTSADSPAPNVTDAPATQAPTDAPATQAPTDAPAASNPTDAPAASSPATEAPEAEQPANSAPSTKADIVKLFNESANKVKTSASKVTRNYEDLQNVPEELVLPSSLQSIANPLMEQFLKRDDTPVDYATQADIQANFPVAGESWSAKVTEADLADAVCTDDGTSYNVTLKFNESVDPQPGTGAASAFSVIREDQVMGVPGVSAILKSFSIRYHDAEITCKIDKATGNMTEAHYKLPIVMDVQASLLVTTVDATIGMVFDHDYSISY